VFVWCLPESGRRRQAAEGRYRPVSARRPRGAAGGPTAVIPPARIDGTKQSFHVNGANLLWAKNYQDRREHTKAMTVSNGRELFTQRLHLRCPVEADASAIIAIAGDWDVARRLGRVPHPYTQADFRFFIERVVPSEPTWAIVVRRTGAFGSGSGGTAQSAAGGH
jgi:hypothetical protein